MNGRRSTRVAAVAAAVLTSAAAGPAAAPAGTEGTTASAGVTRAELAVRWAVRQAGTHELGTSNCGTKVLRWQRNAGWAVPPCRPWCGAFVHEAYRQAGADLPSAFLYPERVLADIRAGRRGMRPISVTRVRRGDMVLYKWPGSGSRADHFGIIVRSYRPGSGSVTTAEGNTAHAVRVETRSTRYVVAAARVLPAQVRD